jgi:hyperosmotically inducible protein
MRQQMARLAVAVATVFAVACGQSDLGITTAVKARLAKDDIVKAYQIDVDTSDRVVTLKGTVGTTAAKEQAVNIARYTDGVRNVVDELTVNPQVARNDTRSSSDIAEKAKETAQEIGQKSREAAERAAQATGDAARQATSAAADRTQAVVADAATTSAVKTKLLADRDVSGLKIDVDTTDGIVTLNGRVPTRTEATRAVALARETSGVKQVVDKLRVGQN